MRLAEILFPATLILTWQPNTDGIPITGYEAQWGIKPGKHNTVIDLGLPPTDANGRITKTLDVPTLDKSKPSYWVISAYNDAGRSEFSEEVTIGGEEATVKPTKPEGVTITIQADLEDMPKATGP